MKEVILPAVKRLRTGSQSQICFELPVKCRDSVWHMMAQAVKKGIDSFRLRISSETDSERRSREISDHFHAHVTQINTDLRAAGIQVSRDEIYIRILLLACEIETEGGSPYPYLIIDDVLRPKRTTMRNNKQMMTAVEACHRFALVDVVEKWEADPVVLREKEWE